jgi:cell filamentation protein
VTYEAEHDPLCYPGTSVLINKADLNDQAELDEYEFAMFQTRIDEPLPAGFLDFAHYRAIHHHLFQDIYDWAGQPRTIRIAKGGNWFCYPEHIVAEADRAFQWLADHEYLVSLETSRFAESAAHFLSELNAIHPFREGNGRTQLAFLKLLALNADRPFNDEVLDPERTLSAMIDSFRGDLAPLTALIADVIA